MLSRWVAVRRPPSWETACITGNLGWAEAPSPLVGVGWGVGTAPTSPVPAGAPPGPDRWRWPGPLNVPPPRGAARASIRPQASTPGHSLSLSCQPPPEHSPQEPGHPSSCPGGEGAVPLCACVGHSHHPPSSGPLPGSATPGQPPPGEGATASGSLCSRRCPIWTSRPVTEPPGMPLTQPCRLDLHGHKGGFPRRPCGRGGAGAGEQGRGLSCLEDAAAGAANGQRHERTVVCCRLSGKEHSVFTGVAIVHCCSHGTAASAPPSSAAPGSGPQHTGGRGGGVGDPRCRTGAALSVLHMSFLSCPAWESQGPTWKLGVHLMGAVLGGGQSDDPLQCHSPRCLL